MRRPLITASALDRVLQCPASAALPTVSTTSKAAERGSVVHEYLCRVIDGSTAENALALVPDEHRARCSRIPLSRLLAKLDHAKAEPAYALHAATGTASRLGYNIGRDYQVDDGHIAGSTDVEALDGRADNYGRPVVIDWKTGQDVTPARDNAQIKFAAACAMQMCDEYEVEGRIVYLFDDGGIRVDSAVFTAIELDAFIDEVHTAHVQALAARDLIAAGNVPNVKMGDHCRYCPAMASCPAHVGLARQLTVTVDDLKAKLATLSPQEAGDVYTRLKVIKRQVEVMDDGLKALARQSPIPLAQGKELRECSSERRKVDAEALARLAAERGASEEDLASAKVFDADRVAELARGLGATEDEINACSDVITVTSIRETKVKS